MKAFTRGSDLLQALCPVLGLDPNNVRRLVIDASFEDVVIAHAEMVGTNTLLEVLTPLAGGMDVRILEAPPSAEQGGS